MDEKKTSQADEGNGAELITPKRKAGKKILALMEELESAKAELADKTDKFLRLAADYDNFRKRKIREFDELVATANEKLILQLIPIVDDFERALASARHTQDIDSFLQGIDMIQRQVMEMLTRQGVQEIEAKDQVFDPHIHEAVMVMEKEDVPPDQVVEEIQKGYTLNNKVLRAAKVVVSK